MSDPKKRFNVPKEVYLLVQKLADKMNMSVDDAVVMLIKEHVRGGVELKSKPQSPYSLGMHQIFEAYTSLDSQHKSFFSSVLQEYKIDPSRKPHILKRLETFKVK